MFFEDFQPGFSRTQTKELIAVFNAKHQALGLSVLHEVAKLLSFPRSAVLFVRKFVDAGRGLVYL